GGVADRAQSDFDRKNLIARYGEVRQRTEELCQPLEIEDYQIQSMPDASPAKWHLAHTAWFFETFILPTYEPGYKPFHDAFSYLFNSYYNSVGDRWPRPARGVLSRPTVKEVYGYRQAIDERIVRLLNICSGDTLGSVCPVLVLGLNHEQQ